MTAGGAGSARLAQGNTSPAHSNMILADLMKSFTLRAFCAGTAHSYLNILTR